MPVMAAGMFGSSSAAAKMNASLKNWGAEIDKHNYPHIDDILALLAEDIGVDVVLLVECAVRSVNMGVREALDSIRAADPTVRIIFIKDYPERDYELELWCYERGIYDISYPGRHTEVDIEAIGRAILMGRIDPNDPPPPPVDTAETPERAGFTDKLKNILSEMPSMPEFKLPPMPERKPRRPEMSVTAAPRHIQSIAVVNCSRGFGATTLTVQLAECLHMAGRDVSAVSLDMSGDLAISGLIEKGVAVFMPSGDTLPDIEALSREYRHIVIDFGTIFEFLPSGAWIPAQSRAETARIVQDTLLSSDLRIYLTSEEPWHRNKSGVFSSDKDGFLLPAHEADASTILHTLGVL